MVRSPRRGSGVRYRGRSGPAKWVVVGVIVLLVAAGAAYWLLRDKLPSPVPVQPSTAVAASPTVPATAQPTPIPLPAAPEVRGIYISGPVAGDPYMDSLITLLDETELNAVVIDVKNDEGNLTYIPASGTAVEAGACVRYIRDLPALVAELKEHGVYTIARVSAFKDPVFAKARPELAMRYADGSAVSEGGGLAWLNPYERENWDYLIEVALGAADAGFDEVQFDYVRFPTGKDMDQVDYGPAAAGVSREDAIIGFLEAARTALHRQGVLVSADVFGTVINIKTDAALIGQDYARMGGAVDFLCPMVYPSHYAAGSFGIEIPDREPHQTVLEALQKSQTALSGVKEGNRAGVRAWLQDFTATWVKGHMEYGGTEIRAQIQAVYDAGYRDWILWNAKNNYTADGLLPADGKAGN